MTLPDHGALDWDTPLGNEISAARADAADAKANANSAQSNANEARQVAYAVKDFVEAPTDEQIGTKVAEDGSSAADAVDARIDTKVPAASATEAGKVELATSDEVTTGTDAARAVTPAGVKAVLDPIRDLSDETFATNLSASYALLSKSAINTLQRGLTPDATAADNVSKLNALVAEARSEGRALKFPATDADINLNTSVYVGGVALEGEGPGSRLRMTATTGLYLLRVDQPGTLIEGLYLSSAAVRDTAWATSGGANDAILIDALMHDTLVQGVTGENWTTVVHCGGGATPTYRLVAREITGLNVGFAVNWRGVKDFEAVDIRGQISFDKTNQTSAPPHLVYIAAVTDGSIPDSANGIIRGVQGWDSSSSNALVKVDRLVGGTISDVVGRACSGLLTIDSSTDVRAERLIAIDDGLSGTPSIYVTNTSLSPTRIKVRDAMVKFAAGDHAVGIHVKSGVDCSVKDASVFTNRTTTTSQGAVVGEGGNPKFEDVRVSTLGAGRTNPAILLTGTDGARVVRPRADGTIYGVQMTSAPNTTIEYDPADMTGLAVHNSAAPMVVDTASQSGLRVTVPNLPPLNEDAPVAWFSAARRAVATSVPFSATQSGHAITASGTWSWAASQGGVYNSDNVSNAAAWLDIGTANHFVETLVKFAGAAVGVSARVTDTSTRLYAEVDGAAITLNKREAGSNTQLATVAVATAVGQRVKIGVAVVGSQVQVYLDGTRVITHTLTGGNETTFASQTAAGLHVRSASGARFLSARFLNLTA